MQASSGMMGLTSKGSYADASCMLHFLNLTLHIHHPLLPLQQYLPGLPADAGLPLGSVGMPGGGPSAATSCSLPCLLPFLDLAPTASPVLLPPAGSALAGPAGRCTFNTLACWRSCLGLPCWPLGAAKSAVAPPLAAPMSAPASNAAASAAGPLPAALRPLPAFPLPAADWLLAGVVAEALAEGGPPLPAVALPAEGWRLAGASVRVLPFFFLPGPLSKPGGASPSSGCCRSGREGWLACACSKEPCPTPCRCTGIAESVSPTPELFLVQQLASQEALLEGPYIGRSSELQRMKCKG